ncbi:hypothetical protein HPY86_06420 [candidate division WOR-3 bacterium]|jgi:hypothetical protein|nr:hypothetical protein [candidate division WOR-3 bacterium]
MKLKRPRPSNLLLAGLLMISLGWAASANLGPAEALIPIAGVIAGLTILTTVVSGGPRAFL